MASSLTFFDSAPAYYGTPVEPAYYLGAGFTLAPTAAASFSFTGVATGKVVYPSSATASATFTGTAAGKVTVPASGIAAFAFTGLATGTLPTVEVATGTAAWAFAGTATGVVHVAATATGSATFTGLATGAVVTPASGTATWAFAGTAVGTLPAVEVATGTAAFAFTGTAAGQSAAPGFGIGTAQATFTGVATGHVTVPAAGTLSATFTGTAAGASQLTIPALATASFAFTGTAHGVAPTAGSATGTFAFTGSATGVATIAVNPKISTLVDDFNTGVLDPSKWEVLTVAEGSGGPVNIVNGQLCFPVTEAGTYGTIQTVDFYDLTESAVFMQLVDGGDQSAETTNDTWPVWVQDATGLGFGIEVQNGFVYTGFPAGINGPTFTYDPAVHKWFRIRESGGVLYEDYSTDGSNWVNLASTAYNTGDTFEFISTAVVFQVNAGFAGDAGPATTDIFDNVNIVPPPIVYTFTPPTVREVPTYGTAEERVPASRLLSFYKPRPRGVAVFKMATGVYWVARMVPGLPAGPWLRYREPSQPLPREDQVNETIATAWLYSEPIFDYPQRPDVDIVYYGGMSYTVDADEVADLERAGLGPYVTASVT